MMVSKAHLNVKFHKFLRLWVLRGRVRAFGAPRRPERPPARAVEGLGTPSRRGVRCEVRGPTETEEGETYTKRTPEKWNVLPCLERHENWEGISPLPGCHKNPRRRKEVFGG